MDLTAYKKMAYENNFNQTFGENKPKQSQIANNQSSLILNHLKGKANSKFTLSAPVLSKVEGVEWANFPIEKVHNHD